MLRSVWQVSSEVMTETFRSRAAPDVCQTPRLADPPMDPNSPASSQAKTFPFEIPVLASSVSLSQQLSRHSTDVVRFLRKRTSRKAARGAALGAGAQRVGLRNLQPF